MGKWEKNGKAKGDKIKTERLWLIRNCGLHRIARKGKVRGEEQDDGVQRWGVRSGEDKMYGCAGGGGEGGIQWEGWAKIKQEIGEYKGGKAGEEKVRRVLVEAREGQKVMECRRGREGKAGGTWVHVWVGV